MKKTLIFIGILSIIVLVPIIAGAETVEIPNPLKYDDPLKIIGAITGLLQMLAIAVAVIIIIIAGIQYMTSAGSEDKAKKAKNMIVYALIGVAIVTAVNFIIGLIEEILGKLN
jgi:amino acid transporter